MSNLKHRTKVHMTTNKFSINFLTFGKKSRQHVRAIISGLKDFNLSLIIFCGFTAMGRFQRRMFDFSPRLKVLMLYKGIILWSENWALVVESLIKRISVVSRS